MSMIDAKVLVLNRSCYPVGLCTVRNAFKLICEDAAVIMNVNWEPFDFASWVKEPVEEGDETIGMVSGRIKVPRVIRLSTFDNVPNLVVKFSRKNVFHRDGFTCCYCSHKFAMNDLDLEHVIPRSQGGKTDWLNIVTSCRPCNQKKGGRTPRQAGMTLKKNPYKPSYSHMNILIGGKIHKDWLPFLDNKMVA